MFSLGVIFYILLFKDLPFDSENNRALVEKNKECNIEISQS